MKEKQFLEVFQSQKNIWYRYAIWSLRDPLDSQDIIQETYLKLWKVRDRLKEVKDCKGYGFRIVRNLCIDRLKNNNSHLHSINDYHSLENSDDASSLVEFQDSNKIIARIVASLPEMQRLVLQLNTIEGMTIAEAAKDLNTTTNAINANLSRARKKIREEYLKWMNYESKQN